MTIVEAPWPQPTSATLAPALSFASTPSSAGIQLGNEVGIVAGPEEALGAREQALRMLVPADALAGSKRLGDLRLVEIDRLRDIECAGEKRRRTLFRERHHLFGRKRKGIFFGVVIDVTGCRLAGQPFTHIAFVQPGFFCQFRRVTSLPSIIAL